MINDRQEKLRGNLQTKMMYFLKRKCIFLFKFAFATWQHRYERKVYARQAVDEFSKFRERKTLKECYDYWTVLS